MIEVTSRDGAASATVSLHQGRQRQVIINCAPLLLEHELLIRSLGHFSSAGIEVLSARPMQGNTIAKLLVDIADGNHEGAFVVVYFLTNLGTFDVMLDMDILKMGRQGQSQQTYPLSQG